MSNTAKIPVTEPPQKSISGQARLFKIKDQGEYWIPENCFFGYNPGIKMAEVECWILDKKGIKYKV